MSGEGKSVCGFGDVIGLFGREGWLGLLTCVYFGLEVEAKGMDE
jgi:hypothetical protein